MSHAAEFVPAQVFHPVEYLMDELTARGWTLDDLATRIVVGRFGRWDDEVRAAWSLERFGWDIYFSAASSADLAGHCRMGEHGAEDLHRVLGIDAGLWLAHEKLYAAAPAERRSPPPDVEAWLSDTAPPSTPSLLPEKQPE